MSPVVHFHPGGSFQLTIGGGHRSYKATYHTVQQVVQQVAIYAERHKSICEVMSGLLSVLSILAIESDRAASQGNRIPSVQSAGGLDLHKVTTHFVKAQVTVRKHLSGCQHQRHG